ncbi:uncharacterized protein [Argopecten irradians]|uniref:uncharacterized protein n=1 Tax=Argopecten irradians TaxID=31199 RepID=UPI00371989AD
MRLYLQQVVLQMINIDVFGVVFYFFFLTFIANLFIQMPGKRVQYDREDMMKAVDAVTSKTMSLRKAAQHFSIPKSTLSDRVNERYGSDPRLGRPPALPDAIEDKIVNTVKAAAKQGMGISRRQLLARTGDLCRKYKVTPFKNVTPSNQWWEGIKKRHPELSIRRPEKLSSSRARMLNPTVVEQYMTSLGDLITSLNLQEKPECIWNCDETGRSFEHTPVRVIAEKKSKNVVGRTSNNRTNVSIMACVNAAGKTMSPMFVVKGKTNVSIHGFDTSAAPVGTKWAVQENGWMTDKIGEQWFRDIFLAECGEERPQLLVLDGHSSHESLAILELARENNISILCLPPHTTHILQPLDRSVFGPFSNAYNTACSDYMAQNPLNSVSKWNFPGLVKCAWDSSFTVKNIQNGFRVCGIFPFNPNAISKESYAPSKPTDRPVSSCTQSSIDVSAAPCFAPKLMENPSSSDISSIKIPSASLLTVPSPVVDPHTPSHTPSPSSTIVSSVSLEIHPLDASPISASVAEVSLGSDFSHPSVSPLLSPPEIEHPELLLNLLSTDQLEVNVEPADHSIWNSEIEKLFLPPKPSPERAESSLKKRNTSHRLLTSDEVVEQKREIQVKKEKKEELKKERALKKLSKTNSK